jgi:DNA-binding NarL/FixJ family response regulator
LPVFHNPWLQLWDVIVKQILIADDHEVVRTGLRAIIETRADWIVCAEAADGKEGLELVSKLKPDVAIVDYSMPVMNGLEVCRRVKSDRLQTGVLILTMFEDEKIMTDAMLAGARGILLKSDARYHLVAAIEALLDRRPYFTSTALEKLLSDYVSVWSVGPAAVLTAREQNVVQLIAEGHTNRSAGAVLNLSVKTVETHRASAMRKLNVSSAAELVRYAVRAKMIMP